jgi:general secretion pathway protein F
MAVLKPLPYRVRAELFTQLARLEQSGVPYDRAIAMMQLPGEGMARLVNMQTLAARGKDAATAGELSGLFTRLEVRLVRAALQASSPAPTYQRLGEFYTARAMQIARIKSRLTMPAAIFVMALFLAPLPALVGGSIGVFGYLWRVVRLPLLIGALYFGARTFASRDAHSTGVSPWRHVPFYGPIFIKRNLRDFFESLALMLEAGISMLDALPAALDAVEDGGLRRELAKIRRSVEQGKPFAAALEGIDCLHDARLLSFAHTGESSGTLPEMLRRHCDFESEEIANWYEQLAEWAPRIIYGFIAAWMVYSILTGVGVAPRVPKDL